MGYSSVGILAAATLATGSLLAACGDPITASRSFVAVVSTTQTQTLVPVNGTLSPVTRYIATGHLVGDAKNQVRVAGSSFQEDCSTSAAPSDPTKTSSVLSCSLALNTGQKFYVAAGETTYGNQTLTGLGASGNTLNVKVIKTQGPPQPAPAAQAGAPAGPLTVVLLVTLRP